MTTNSNSNKLDEKIKESLSNYKVANQTGNWSQMEEMLEKIPTSGSFKKYYLIGGILGLAILGGVYFFINSSTDSKVPENKTIEQPILEKPSVTNTEIAKPEKIVNIPLEKTVVSSEINVKPDVSINKETKLEAKKSILKAAETTKENTISKPAQIIIMGNQPIFGDMLDSARGIISKTKENESTQKSAVINSEKPIGWNKFINSDSLKKKADLELKDSLNKTPH